MINVSAKIDIMAGSVAEVNSVISDINGINVSPDITSTLGKKRQPDIKPFMLGKSNLGTGNHYTKQLPYFVGRELSDSNGDFVHSFANSYTIIIRSSEVLEQMIIVFDTVNNAHPKSITVDGQIYVDDDPQFEIVFRDKTLSHIITINDWNIPNSPIVITSIYANANIEIDERNLLSYESSIFDRANIDYPSYGIISNGGSISFSDYNEQVLDLITQKILHSGITIEIFLNNTLTEKSEQLAKLSIRELTYDNNNRAVDLQLKDDLEEWQEMSVEAIYYDPANPHTENFKWLYDYLWEKTPSKHNMLPFDKLDEETQNVLLNTVIQYPLLESDSLWNEWDKLCQACHLHIYVNEVGQTVCKKVME